MEEKFKTVSSFGFTYYDEKIWLYDLRFGAIESVDINSGSVSVEWLDTDETFLISNMYGGATVVDNKLIFAPRRSKHILEYDVKSKEIKRIPYDTSLCYEGNIINSFVDAVLFDDSIYFFPGGYSGIIRYKFVTGEQKIITDWNRDMNCVPHKPSVYFSNARMVSEKICMLPCVHNGKLLEFHLGTDEWKIHQVYNTNDFQNAFSDITYDGNVYWVSKKNTDSVICWTPEKGIIKEYDCHLDDYKGISFIIDSGESVIIVRRFGVPFVEVNKQTGEYKPINLDSQCNELYDYNLKLANAFCCSRIRNNVYCIYDELHCEWVLVDTNGKSIKRYSAEMNDSDYSTIKMHARKYFCKDVYIENPAHNLKDIIEILK